MGKPSHVGTLVFASISIPLSRFRARRAHTRITAHFRACPGAFSIKSPVGSAVLQMPIPPLGSESAPVQRSMMELAGEYQVLEARFAASGPSGGQRPIGPSCTHALNSSLRSRAHRPAAKTVPGASALCGEELAWAWPPELMHPARACQSRSVRNGGPGASSTALNQLHEAHESKALPSPC